MDRQYPKIYMYTDGASSGNPGPGGYGVVPGQQVHYFKLFGFKRTYSRSPSAFV